MQSITRSGFGRGEENLLNISFTPPLNICRKDPIRVILFTSLANNFERVFLPPVPIIKVNVESEIIANISQEVLTLDGSDSIDREGTIINYTCRVTICDRYNYCW